MYLEQDLETSDGVVAHVPIHQDLIILSQLSYLPATNNFVKWLGT